MRFRSNPRVVLVILTALHFLNFIDRTILFQVQGLVQEEFRVSKAQIGFLTTAFMLCLMVAGLLAGYLGDRVPRRPLIVGGAVLWSVATLLTAATWDFRSLLIRHAIVGIGEGCMVAAPGYVADLFPPLKRGRMLGVLFMAVPVGSALGYLLGGILGHHFGWRAPFYVAGGPGLIAAMLLLMTREPQRGVHDGTTDAPENTIGRLLRNRTYVFATAGITMVAFALGGAQTWLPEFLRIVRGMTMLSAAVFIAALAIVNGVLAPTTAGWLADRLRQRNEGADYTVAMWATTGALPLTLAALYLPRPAMFPAIPVAHFFLLLSWVPLLAAIVQSVGPGVRSTAIAVQGAVMHLFGDGPSPTVIGKIADATGSLQLGLLTCVAAVAIALIILFTGRKYAVRLKTMAHAASA